MSVLWTDKTVVQATGGEAVGTWEASGISIDTRTLQAGDLFIPLKDVRDGHEFIPMAFENGAAAVISERHIEDVPAVIVKSAQQALEDMARSKSDLAQRVAITGSVGKTSVKEMVAHICRAAGKTHASIKSYNNHWGVPYTLAGMPIDTEYGIFEMGMNHAGELAYLSQIVQPDIAAITKIAPAHPANFESIREIAQAKAEVFRGLTPQGLAIVPDDSGYEDAFKEELAGSYVTIKLLKFGSQKGSHGRIVSAVNSPNGSQVELNILGKTVEFELPMVGAHWVENATCALLISSTLGIVIDVAVNALKTMGKISGRGESHAVTIRRKKIILIDEAYNANPESMRAAIAALGLHDGRKVAVLGDMLELGKTEKKLHAHLKSHLENHNIDLVVTCGPLMKALHDELPENINGGWFENSEDCAAKLIPMLKSNDTVMIKGSNASGMSKLVTAFKNNKKTRK
ncbi:MAG: UDP-N-acetylmuramoyl-tripeptide--D-alanyl-D-alanine ligase [Acidimicrobiales bacterium]|nr:MAG: UDP-N-acetylmuramoyl-tripeptide--D-alanyl-D-alanine ligase [Acidimicrobiales bacterium]